MKPITYPQHHVVYVNMPNTFNAAYGDIPVTPTCITKETFIPRLLVDLGVMPSTSEVKRNRKDLWEDVAGTGFQRIEVGKRIVDIFYKGV